MPYRKTIFTENSYYHTYNRGVEKRTIFLDDLDYNAFLEILSYYLIPNNKPTTSALTRTGLVHNGLFANSIKLISYCLMPNHFHLLLYQTFKNAITEFYRHVGTTYSMYFNRKYERVGSLFQGRFKAKHITTDNYLLYTSKYIHQNPQSTRTGLVEYPWSSYKQFLNSSSPSNLAFPQPILDYFSKTYPNLGYQAFVEDDPLPSWYLNDLDWIGKQGPSL